MKEITISNDRRHMGVLRHFPWGDKYYQDIKKAAA